LIKGLLRQAFFRIFNKIKVMRGRRTWCEDVSPIIKSIRSHKNHGKIMEINGKQYECIGGDIFLDVKTNRIEKLAI
jgi:hypothetical protein